MKGCFWRQKTKNNGWQREDERKEDSSGAHIKDKPGQKYHSTIPNWPVGPSSHNTDTWYFPVLRNICIYDIMCKGYVYTVPGLLLMTNYHE